jgi:parallel beta-helix repeat protein
MKNSFRKYALATGFLTAIAVLGLTFPEENFALFSESQAATGKKSKAHKNKAGDTFTKQIERQPVRTAKSLPIRNLKCAPPPASNLVINVMAEGAVGNGKTDDTLAIQRAVNKVADSGATVLIPAGTYLIDAVAHLNLTNNMTLKMEEGAILKAIPNNKENYGIIKIKNVQNVNVIGGIVQGERDQHEGKTGEWGMGVELYGSKNVVIENVIAKDNWGDGFYVNDNASNTAFCGVIADNNRRQGISVISANRLVIRDSVFQRTQGTEPMAGIDIEPNSKQNVTDVRITNNVVMHNSGSGIISTVSDEAKGTSYVKNAVIDGNTVVNNGRVGSYSAGIYINRQTGQKITNNIVNSNLQDGIAVVSDSTENLVSGNITNGNGNPKDKKFGSGILIYEANDNIIENNSSHRNEKFDILDFNAKNKLKSNKAATVKSGWP